jgi:ABC-2 type transport system permease protein
MKKEFTEQIRSGRLLILGLIFVFFGIMNPAVAKLTPWILDLFSDSIAGSGIIVTEVTVSAMDSWVQFFKNIPMGLIAFVLLESNLFTKEYTSGTLILSLTKGLERYKIVISKVIVLTLLWTACYWICFAITYGYNAYFWDNSIANNLVFSVVCWWLFGMMVLALIIFFSTIFSSNTGVLLGTGVVVLVSYLIGLLPKWGKYLPTFLTNGNALIYGLESADAFYSSLFITITVSMLFFAVSIPIFNKKQL